MVKREQRHSRRRSWLPEVAVVLVVAVALAGLRFDLGGRLFGWSPVDPSKNPAAVQPPKGLRLPPVPTAAPVAVAPSGGAVDPAKVAAAVAPYLKDKRLGRTVDVLVGQLDDGTVVYRHGSGLVTPASTNKLLTTTAALDAIGPMARFRTTVDRVPATRQIILVGGGDPFLMSTPKAAKGLYPARADVLTLARRTAASLKQQGLTQVRVGYDASLFSGPATNPTWPATYADVVPPISALWVNEGRNPDGAGYLSNPALGAAEAFRADLVRLGIAVPRPPVSQVSPAAVTEVAHIDSAPLGEIVQHTLDVSDNTAAEVIARHVGLSEEHVGSFAASVRGVEKVLGSLGISTSADRLYDGSGLSRSDKLDPATILQVLVQAASPAHPQLRDIITGLPVAGFTGSLAERFDEGAAAGRGRVRAKTGTLTGVNGLAGIATDLDGDQLVFVAIANHTLPVNTIVARVGIDKLAAALGACRCGAGT